jgi:hypothetical protein
MGMCKFQTQRAFTWEGVLENNINHILGQLKLLGWDDFLIFFYSLLCKIQIFLVLAVVFFSFFLIYMGCPGQLTRTTTIPHGLLDILQAQEQVRHHGGDRRAHRRSNPERGRNKSHNWPQQLDPQVTCSCFLVLSSLGIKFKFF